MDSNQLHRQASASVERLELVGLDRCLILMEVCQRILCTIVVRVIVGIDGLRLETRNGIELLDRGSTEPRQRPENSTLDLCHLCVLHGVDEGVLRLGRMVLQLLGSVLLTNGAILLR